MGSMAGMRGMMRVKVVFLFLLFVGCTHIYTARGVYYRVQPRDSLEGIAKKYRVELQELAEINNIQREQELKSGRSLYIPGIRPRDLDAIIEGKTEKKGRTRRTHASLIPSSKIEVDHGRFVWPVTGGLSSNFGIRRGRRHDGIDIRAKRGTPLLVAADGEVVYSKRMRGYGNLILVKHEGDFFTVYAHNSVNLVKKGKGVKQGEVIAKVGQSGRATGPHLHFEVREGTKPRNPIFFLPKIGDIPGPGEKGEAYGGSEE
jgi:murein DD-endopeptidase MepM/ murein hydrolase activator NlpD